MRTIDIQIATPCSSLFSEQGHEDILHLSDCLEIRDTNIEAGLPDSLILHSDMQIIHTFSKRDIAHLEKAHKLNPDLKMISFHAASSCDKPYLVDGIFQPNGTQYSPREMIETARNNISAVRKALGCSINIAVENNNYYPTEAYQYVADADFISKMTQELDIFFLMDIAHAKITAHNKAIDYDEYKQQLPLKRLLQLHISAHSVDDNNLARDTHDFPDNEYWQELRVLLKTHCSIQYVTLEYYKDKPTLLKGLEQIKEIIDELS